MGQRIYCPFWYFKRTDWVPEAVEDDAGVPRLGDALSRLLVELLQPTLLYHGVKTTEKSIMILDRIEITELPDPDPILCKKKTGPVPHENRIHYRSD